jgi:LPXTG-site transpeptidase (sortase) family protein
MTPTTRSKKNKEIGLESAFKITKAKPAVSSSLRFFDKPWKKIIVGVAAILILIFATNFGFFWSNIKFFFVKPQVELSEDLKQPVPKQKIEPNLLIIETLGIKVPVVYTEESNEPAWQEALKRGVVHFAGTAKPGEYGNVYIFGHSSDYAWSGGDYKTVFALLPHIQNGSEIIISDWAGNVFKYKVKETKVVNPDDLSVLDQKNYEKKILTLQTSYPIGTALRRFIVMAEIEEQNNSQALPEVGT